MTEYAHNHPPRCCCEPNRRPEADDYCCPLCPEHGELAQLDKADYSGMAEAEKAAFDAALVGNGYLLDGKRVPPEDVTIVARTDYEYACCHQLVGRPHTDYCQAPNAQRERLGMTYEPQHHTTPDGDTHPVHQCHPDRCGMWATTTTASPATHINAPDPHHPGRVRPEHGTNDCRPDYCGSGEWNTQTTQPATQTSTPTTQTRTPEDLVGHLRDAVDRARQRRTADQVVEDNKGQRWHETGPDEAHETWQCSTAKCGRERTPLGEHTPPQATTRNCGLPGCTRCPHPE